MKLDLRNENLYNEDFLSLDNPITYVFGRNGTGKSTLTRIIKEQLSETMDVRVFHGFNSIIRDDNKLEAVVLGEENVEIQKQIEEINKTLETVKNAKEDAEKKINQPENPGEINLWTKRRDAMDKKDKAEDQLDKFYSAAAKRIKMYNPSVVITYNKNKFEDDIPKAMLISEGEESKCKEVLRTEIKVASDVIFPEFDIESELSAVNDILKQKVEKRLLIERLENNSEKQKFAYKGLEIHKPGEVCAFCGNRIDESTFAELKNYFSADEMEILKKDVESKINELKLAKPRFDCVYIKEEEFYPEYKNEITELKKEYAKAAYAYKGIIDGFIENLNEKRANLVAAMEPIVITEEQRPEQLKIFDRQYKKLRDNNNSSDLQMSQKGAKERLRLHLVAKEIRAAVYESLKKAVGDENKAYELIRSEFEKAEECVNACKNQEKGLKQRIQELQLQTCNEKRLADNINENLRLSTEVNFELEHYKDAENKGYYRIKDIKTGETRPVTEVSDGEKNIIAFLYFIEKLNEVRDNSIPQMIVFDDPMSSNDEQMISLIVDLIKNKLIWQLNKRKKGENKLVLLTHNVYFFRQVEGYYNKDDFYSDNTVLKLEKEDYITNIIKINNKDEDVKSAYANLWADLKGIYDSDKVSSEAMLTPIRRIVETYSDFEGISKYDFCGSENMLLLNEGSHGGDDRIQCTESKKSLLIRLCRCFKNNNAEKHLQEYLGKNMLERIGM